MTRKRSGKQGPAKKRAAAKSVSKAQGKSTPKKVRGSGKKSTDSRSKRGPLSRMKVAGEKTWKALKSRTSRMMEGMKETFGGE